MLVAGVSSNQFFRLWVFLEISRLIFLFIIFLDEDQIQWEAATKYFLVQALRSLLLLISALACSVGFIKSFKVILVVRVILKLGSAPLHWWLVRVFKSSSFLVILIITIPQKLLPLLALEISSIGEQNLKLFLVNLLFRTLIIAQIGVKELLAFSRLFRVGWMPLMLSTYVFSKLIIIYLIVIRIFIIIRNLNSSIREMRQEFRLPTYLNSIAVLSLAGIPPLPGFFLKLIILQALLNQREIASIVFIVISSINFYGYFKFLISSTPESFHRYFEVLIFKQNTITWAQMAIWATFFIVIV